MISVKIVCVQLTRKKVFQQKKDKTTNYLSSGITGIVYVLYLRIKEWNVSINIGSVPNLLQCASYLYYSRYKYSRFFFYPLVLLILVHIQLGNNIVKMKQMQLAFSC